MTYCYSIEHANAKCPIEHAKHVLSHEEGDRGTEDSLDGELIELEVSGALKVKG